MLNKLTVFYNADKMRTLRRTETNTVANFMATCGGLFGLFLGISALGFIEIVYFLSLRLFWKIRKSFSEITIEEFDQSMHPDSETKQNEVSTYHFERILLNSFLFIL